MNDVGPWFMDHHSQDPSEKPSRRQKQRMGNEEEANRAQKKYELFYWKRGGEDKTTRDPSHRFASP